MKRSSTEQLTCRFTVFKLSALHHLTVFDIFFAHFCSQMKRMDNQMTAKSLGKVKQNNSHKILIF